MEDPPKHLPFPVPSYQHRMLEKWRTRAVAKEAELVARKKRQCEELKRCVQQMIQAKNLDHCTPKPSKLVCSKSSAQTRPQQQQRQHEQQQQQQKQQQQQQQQQQQRQHEQQQQQQQRQQQQQQQRQQEEQQQQQQRWQWEQQQQRQHEQQQQQKQQQQQRQQEEEQQQQQRRRQQHQQWQKQQQQQQKHRQQQQQQHLLRVSRNRPRPSSGSILSAVVKGFLTRRLYHSNKVQLNVTIIKDALNVLASLPALITTKQDRELQQRMQTQLSVARMTLHQIFFQLTPAEQMAYISHSRTVRQLKMYTKEPTPRAMHNPTGRPADTADGRTARSALSATNTGRPKVGGGKLSTATIKCMQRRQKASRNTSNI